MLYLGKQTLKREVSDRKARTPLQEFCPLGPIGTPAAEGSHDSYAIEGHLLILRTTQTYPCVLQSMLESEDQSVRQTVHTLSLTN